MLLFYDWPFLQVCILQENVLFSTLILGSVFSDCVIYHRNTNWLPSNTSDGMKKVNNKTR